MLSQIKQRGQLAAFKKYALNPPTQVDTFMANVESGKDIPLDPSSLVPGNSNQPLGENPDSSNLPQDPSAALGQMVGALPAQKSAALGLEDMLFFEKQLGHQEAGNLFHDLDRQWRGQPGFARKGTLNISPKGVEFQARQPIKATTPPMPPATPKLTR